MGKKPGDYTHDQIIEAYHRNNFSVTETAKELNINRTTLNAYFERTKIGGAKSVTTEMHQTWKESRGETSWVIESNDPRINTVDDAIKRAGVDMGIWQVERVIVNGWDVTMKLKTAGGDKAFTKQNQQIKIFLKRIVPLAIQNAVENLLNKLKSKSPICPKLKYPKLPKQADRKALEICLMDPHYGMRCYAPGSAGNQTPESMAALMLDIVDTMLERTKHFRPFEQIIFPIGNDFFHADSIWQTTTAGTLQPEADAFFHTFIGGEQLVIGLVDRLKAVSPVSVYAIPGNHDRTASFMLGRILRAYYQNDKNVTVDASEKPYKFHRYGCNLIGYEHGHSVKPALRLGNIMANERPEDWAATKNGWREFHIGDQHRKGVSRPVVMEEQGVSIEFLPGLTMPNEWHTLKGYNWQKRAAIGFVWHYSEGLIDRPQVNIDRYSNIIMK